MRACIDGGGRGNAASATFSAFAAEGDAKEPVNKVTVL
jgi:hypothetical protein